MNYSFSCIDCYKQCPRKFRFSYIDKEPKLDSPAKIKGQKIHQALYEYFSNNKELDLTSEYKNEFTHFLRWEAYRKSQYITEEDYKPKYLELKLTDEKLRIVGVIDRIEKLPNGKYAIIDYKTNAKKDFAKYRPQLTLYTHLTNLQTNLDIDNIDYYGVFWLCDGQLELYEIDDNTIDKIINDIKTQIFLIDTEKEYKPKVTPLCCWCEYLHICPKQKDILKIYNKMIKEKKLDMETKIKEANEYRQKHINTLDSKQMVIYSKVFGTTFRKNYNPKDIKLNDTLILEREPLNTHDKNAIKILHNSKHIGYIGKDLAVDMSLFMDAGSKVSCRVENITGGTKSKDNIGINVKITIEKSL